MFSRIAATNLVKFCLSFPDCHPSPRSETSTSPLPVNSLNYLFRMHQTKSLTTSIIGLASFFYWFFSISLKKSTQSVRNFGPKRYTGLSKTYKPWLDWGLLYLNEALKISTPYFYLLTFANFVEILRSPGKFSDTLSLSNKKLLFIRCQICHSHT